MILLLRSISAKVTWYLSRPRHRIDVFLSVELILGTCGILATLKNFVVDKVILDLEDKLALLVGANRYGGTIVGKKIRALV